MIKTSRYTRNMAQDGISQEQQDKLMNAKVIVMGAGGLGSGVIMNLAALGVGHIKIIDGDIIEQSNFNRQIIHKYKNIGRAKVISAKDWVSEFNPDIKVDLEKVILDNTNYQRIIDGYNIIIDCFDSYDSKYFLNDIAIHHNKILIHGAIQSFKGQVTTINPNRTGCLNCVLDKPYYLKDEVFASFSPVVNIISSLQAQEAFKVITGVGIPLYNKLLIFDGIESEFKVLNYTKSFTCKVCSKAPEFEL